MTDGEIELGRPRVVGDVVLRPIARRHLVRLEEGPAGGCLASLEPLGLIVEADGDSQAVDLDGDELGEDVLSALDLEP